MWGGAKAVRVTKGAAVTTLGPPSLLKAERNSHPYIQYAASSVNKYVHT